MREILDGSKRIMTPSMTLLLKHPLCQSRKAAKTFADSLVYQPLDTLVQCVSEYLQTSVLYEKLSIAQKRFSRIYDFDFTNKLSCGFCLQLKKTSIHPKNVASALRLFLNDFNGKHFIVLSSSYASEVWSVYVIIIDPSSLIKQKVGFTSDHKRVFFTRVRKNTYC